MCENWDIIPNSVYFPTYNLLLLITIIFHRKESFHDIEQNINNKQNGGEKQIR